MVDKKLSETESLNYTTEVPVYVAVVKYSDNTEQAITENRKIPLSQFAKDSLVLHNTGNETILGTKEFNGVVRVKASTPETQYQSTTLDITQDGWSSGRNTIAWCKDKNGYESGGVYNNIGTNDSNVKTSLYAIGRGSGSQVTGTITVGVRKAGTIWASAPTPSNSSSTSENFIATTGWVNNPSASTNVVHRSTDETITGAKTLQRGNDDAWFIKKANGDITDSAPSVQTAGAFRVIDKNDLIMGDVRFVRDTSGTQVASLVARNKVTGTQVDCAIQCRVDKNGSAYTYAPTPATSDNSTKIATTAFMTNKLHYNAVMGGRVFDTLFTGPIGTGTITLSHPYTDYDALMIIGSDDNGNYVASYIMTTAELNLIRSYNKPWKLWANANSYWYCAATSTTSSFVMSTENSRIEIIYGIKY